MDIHTALILIDEWISTLDDDELPDKCRQANYDFFSFLAERSFSPDVFIKTVKEVTGQIPGNLWKSEDANQLRHYIAAYNYEEQELRREDDYQQGRSKNQWLQDATRRLFGL